MVILLNSVVMLLIGIVLLAYLKDSIVGDIGGFAFIMVGGICFVVGMIAIPVTHWDINSEIQQFKSVELSITQARTKLDIESAAIYMKIVDANKWLAKKKYWNKTLFDIWIPDEVDDLKPLK